MRIGSLARGWVIAAAMLFCAGQAAADVQPPAEAANAAPPSDWVLADSTVAVVDGAVITLSDVVTETIILRWASGGSNKDFSREAVVRDLVRRRALVAQGRKLRFTATPAEVAAEVRYLAESGGSPAVFRETMARFGLRDADIEGRARDTLFERKYLDLKRQSAFVPETQVRSYYAEHLDLFGNRDLSTVRDEIRERLASQKSREQIDAWIERQVAEGRIRYVPGALE